MLHQVHHSEDSSSENSGSSKILANYGKISIARPSDAFIFGDTVDDVYGGFPTAFSTSVIYPGTMTINADSRNGRSILEVWEWHIYLMEMILDQELKKIFSKWYKWINGNKWMGKLRYTNEPS